MDKGFATREILPRASDPGNFVGKKFEELLGSAATRYFGSGFRSVGHTADGLLFTETPGTTHARAKGAVLYPERWSLDAEGRPREVHVSSFDAIALTGEVLKRGSRMSDDVRLACSLEVSFVEVRAPALPVLDVSELPVEFAIEKTVGSVIRVRANIAGFRVVIHLAQTERGSTSVYQQLHDASAGRVLKGEISSYDPAERMMETFQSVRGESVPLSCLEELALFGQLSQILVYRSKRVDRRQVPNLWLRRLQLHRASTPSTEQFNAWTTLVRDAELAINGEVVHDLKLVSQTDYGARAEASFGYRESP